MTRPSPLWIFVCAVLTGVWAQPASAQSAEPPGARGTLTLNFAYKATLVARGEFKDRQVINQTATLRCPLIAGDLLTSSTLLGPTREQTAAQAKLGVAATREVEAVSPKAVSGMKAMEQQMKACKASGKSQQACASQAMAAMQANPELLEQMGNMGNADPKGMASAEKAVAAAADRIQPWNSEGCAGTMTINNSFQADDPTIAGPEPVVKTFGVQKISTREPWVTVETDLSRKETRYLFVSPQASGFRRDPGDGSEARTTTETLSVMPVGHVLLGPNPGAIQSGRYNKPVDGGSLSVEWSFTRGR